MHRSKWCNRKRSVGVTAHVIAPASKFSHCRSFSHLFLFTILPVKRTQETRNIHSSTLLSTSMATKGCRIFFPFPARVHEVEPIEWLLGTPQPSTISLEIGPQIPWWRAGNRASVSSKAAIWKSGPNLSRARGESSLRPFAYKLGPLPTTPHLGGQPIHTRAFAT